MPLVFVNLRDWEWKMLVPQGRGDKRTQKKAWKVEWEGGREEDSASVRK